MQLIVYTPLLTPRIDYIVSTIFTAIGFNDVKIVSEKESYLASDKARINYSDSRITNDECWIKPVQLLYENQIQEQAIKFNEWNRLKAFFQTNDGDIPFDLLAASFYLITRYEEYLPHDLDEYGRYAHTNSIAYKEGFLNLPLINLWLKEFVVILSKLFPSVQLNPPPFSFIPTYDIDIAYSYLEKGIRRTAGGIVKSLVKGDLKAVQERIKVLRHKQKDPFDSYDWLEELHKNYNLNPIYFFLVAQQNKEYDKNILPGKLSMKDLIERHAKEYTVGVHPSWQSGDEESLIKEEITILKNLTGKDIYKSRQHYIRLDLPFTLRQLIAAGIREDYSMGYGSINGFRASYCMPYKWYDLLKEKTTDLTIYPFCYMDANSFYEQHYTSEQALKEMLEYYHSVKEVKGTLITIWHNHFLGTDKMFAGWKETYKHFIAITSGDTNV